MFDNLALINHSANPVNERPFVSLDVIWLTFGPPTLISAIVCLRFDTVDVEACMC